VTKSRENILAGIQPVAMALKVGARTVRRLRVAGDTQNQRVKDLALMAEDAGIEVLREPRERLDQLAGVDRHQGIIAELEDHSLGEADLGGVLDAVTGDPLVLVLDGVQDPHNLGACLRTAEAAGAHAVIIPKDRSAGITPVVRKTSAGASEVVPVLQVTNLARVLRSLKARGIWLAGAADSAGDDIYQRDLTGPLALVMGSEGQGIRRLTAELCDFLVRIPMAGVIESLNVSVATGVCLFEIRRQRSRGQPAG
jgi:23S rRNA (guanosine2251-2'-O)-methyltransferase